MENNLEDDLYLLNGIESLELRKALTGLMDAVRTREMSEKGVTPEKTLEQIKAEIGEKRPRKTLEQIRAEIDERRKPAPLPPRQNVVQLPLWPEPTRGAPNSFLRSALFAAIQGKTRRYMKGELLAAQKGISVKFTGMQLDQSDLDVWQQAVDYAKGHPLGNVCHFKANGFLKEMGRSNGKANYIWLQDAIDRLIACAVEIRCEYKVFTGSLIHECVRDEVSGSYKLTLSPALIKLFGASDWSAIEREERDKLKGKPLALWLHGYYSSHAAPFPLKVETLQELSGSSNPAKSSFKRQLKAALADLENATGRKFLMEGDLVTVGNHPSKSQAKHLSKKSSNIKRY